MSLITRKDLEKAAGLDRLGLLKSPITSAIMKLTKLNKINDLYDKVKEKQGQDFFESLLKETNTDYTVFEQDLARIPKTGPFILVANHPLGALDGIIMTKILTEIRPDFKVMGNFLLTKIKPMAPYVISVNPFENRKEIYSSMAGMREALAHLKEGNCLGIFPAGEVSNKNNPTKQIQDKEWQNSILKLIKKANVPVVPMYFHAQNSRLFYSVSKIHSSLQTLMIPAEMVSKRNTPIRLRIGKAITPKILKEYSDIKDLGDFLRKKVYMMKSYFEDKKTRADFLKINDSVEGSKKQNIEKIITETPLEEILKDIQNLRKKEGKLLFTNYNYEVFFANYKEIPAMMREIGRQREITFRAVGEGTNTAFDLDEYDKHYHHLILWDNAEQKIVGAYRMAMGAEVMKNYGIKGFYTSSLFSFDKEIHPYFNEVIEMGRAYISLEYQQKPLPLFLLWRGIVNVCLKNPEYKYLMGGASISDKFSDFSTSLMIEFLRTHYFDESVAQYVHPKNEYRVILSDEDKGNFLSDIGDDLGKFDKLISDFEPEMRLPVLIKKYIKQNAKVVAFNVDPNFNDAIDGLMYIKIKDLPEETIRPILEEMKK